MGNVIESLKEKINIDCTMDETGAGIVLDMMLDGLSTILESKTVVGEPVEAGGALIVPILEVTAGLAAGAFNKQTKKSGAGAISSKMSPVALLIIQDGKTRLINIKDQDTVTRVMNLAPDIIDRFTSSGIGKDAVDMAKNMIKKHQKDAEERGYKSIAKADKEDRTEISFDDEDF